MSDNTYSVSDSMRGIGMKPRSQSKCISQPARPEGKNYGSGVRVPEGKLIRSYLDDSSISEAANKPPKNLA